MKRSPDHASVSSFNLIFGIALLAFFFVALVPAIVKWVNGSNETSDLKTAVRMTESIADYEDDIFKTTLDAFDVREMIRNNLHRDIDFTPRSSGAAFFYDSSNHRIELRYYRDLKLCDAFGEHLDKSESDDLRCGSLTPEEIFGKGYYLLTDQGSLLPDTIRFCVIWPVKKNPCQTMRTPLRHWRKRGRTR